MGVELHITRAELWSDNGQAPITADEWLACVASDAELELWPENGPYVVRWTGPSHHEPAWLDWDRGNVSTSWPDTALYRKMLRIAQALNAQVQDDEGSVYSGEADWAFDPPPAQTPGGPPPQSAWWKRLLRG